MTRHAFSLLFLATALAACGGGSSSPDDAGPDTGAPDAGTGDAAPPDGATEDAGPPPPPPPADVAGTLRFVGCDPSPTSVTVRLGPTALVTPDVAARPVTEAAPTPSDDTDADDAIDARVEATEEAGVLRFRADEVPWNLYRVGVEVDDEACGDLVWRGPSGGLVVAGDEAVALDALALRTRLQVNAGTEADPRWVSAAYVEDPEEPLRFRMESDLEGVLAYDVQLSFERFEVDALEEGDFCDPPEGAPPVQRFETPPGGREVELDVSAYFSPPEEGASEAEVQRYRIILRGAPVYARVVPVGSAGPLCDLRAVGASSWVRLVLRPRVDVPAVEIPDVPPYHVVGTYRPGEYPVPQIISKDYRCHRVITDHPLPGGALFEGLDDPYGKILVLSGLYPANGTAREGDRFCFAPPRNDDPWYEDVAEGFSDLVGEIVDAVEWAVDRAAALYEQIKSAAVNLVANAIADLTGCEDVCRAALELGMEIALTSMGMPPSLPDFDQLMDQGLDYVAAELAAQAGVPDFVAEQALELAIEMAERAKATRGASYARWLVKDTQGRSSLFELEVSRSAAGASTTWAALWFRPMGPGETVWRERFVGVHPPPVGEGPLRVPVVIEPQLAGLPEVEPLIPEVGWVPAYYGTEQRAEAWYQRAWGQRMGATPCVHFELWGAISTEIPVVIEPIADVTISHDTPLDTFTDPFEMQCAP